MQAAISRNNLTILFRPFQPYILILKVPLLSSDIVMILRNIIWINIKNYFSDHPFVNPQNVLPVVVINHFTFWIHNYCSTIQFKIQSAKTDKIYQMIYCILLIFKNQLDKLLVNIDNENHIIQNLTCIKIFIICELMAFAEKIQTLIFCKLLISAIDSQKPLVYNLIKIDNE